MLPGTELTTGPNTRAKELVPVRVRFPYEAFSEQQLSGEIPVGLARETHCHYQTGLEAKTGSWVRYWGHAARGGQGGKLPWVSCLTAAKFPASQIDTFGPSATPRCRFISADGTVKPIQSPCHRQHLTSKALSSPHVHCRKKISGSPLLAPAPAGHPESREVRAHHMSKPRHVLSSLE